MGNSEGLSAGYFIHDAQSIRVEAKERLSLAQHGPQYQEKLAFLRQTIRDITDLQRLILLAAFAKEHRILPSSPAAYDLSLIPVRDPYMEVEFSVPIARYFFVRIAIERTFVRTRIQLLEGGAS